MGLRLGCIVCTGVEQNEMDLASNRLLILSYRFWYRASNVVLAVVMYCLMLSFSSTGPSRNISSNTQVHAAEPRSRGLKATARSAIRLESLRYPMSHSKATVPTRTCSHKNKYLPQLYQGPLESAPIPPFTPSPTPSLSITSLSVAPKEKTKKTRKPDRKPYFNVSEGHPPFR